MPKMAHATDDRIAAVANPDRRLELRQGQDGVIEIWSPDGEFIGEIRPAENSFRLLMGDADPGGGLTLVWGGDPFTMTFELAP